MAAQARPTGIEGGGARTLRFMKAPAVIPGPAGKTLVSAERATLEATKTLTVPAELLAGDEWLRRYAAAPIAERAALEPEGLRLLEARRPVMAGLIKADPEAAILLTPTPAQRALLPAKLRDTLEQIVSTEGFYGVKAVCNHEPGVEHAEACRIEHEVFIERRSYPVAIYGSRPRRLTEESASLYGVSLDGVLALHEDDVVVRPATDLEPQAPADQWALIYRGKTTLALTADLDASLRSLRHP